MVASGYAIHKRLYILPSRHAPGRHLVPVDKCGVLPLHCVLCVQVNADFTIKDWGGESQEKDTHNSTHACNRHEFIEAVVRIAMMRYVVFGDFEDVSDAVPITPHNARRTTPLTTTQALAAALHIHGPMRRCTGAANT